MRDFLTGMFALLLMGSLFACSDDNDDEVSINTPSAEEFNINDGGTGVTFDQEAVIVGVNGDDASDIGISLMYLLTDIQSKVTENTKLLIVPELSSKYETAIKTVYNNGGVVGVTNPSQSQISEWFEAVDLGEGFIPKNVDDALMFSFGKGFHCCVVYGPDNKAVAVDSLAASKMIDKDSEDFIFKPLLEKEEQVVAEDVSNRTSSDGSDVWTDYETSKYPEVYSYLSSWVRSVNKSFEEKDVVTEEEADAVKRLFAQTRGEKAANDVSTLFAKYPYSIVLSFDANEEIREVLWSDADRIKGHGAVSIDLNIYQIHCYDEAPGAGDYYLVSMSAGLQSEDMYRGKWVNKHGGVWTRLCGYYAKSFAVDCIPWNYSTDAPYTNEDVETIGSTSPETTVGQTVYTTSSSFSLNIGGSVSAGKNLKDDGGKFLNGGVTVSGGWSWTDSKSREISDTDISNTSGFYAINGIARPISKVGWKMTFNNLPYFQWSQSCGINEGNSQTYRSTNYLDANWIWHAKNVKDNVRSQILCIKVRTQATYGTLSFFTTKSDLKEKTFNKFGAFEHVFFLEPISHDRCGTLTIENDFEDDTAITSIQVYKYESSFYVTPKLVWSTSNTVIPGKSVTTSALKTADTYVIYFTTNTGKKYKYSKKSTGKTIELGAENYVYSSTDFEDVTPNE